jgi:hypothetical protein
MKKTAQLLMFFTIDDSASKPSFVAKNQITSLALGAVL